jgi:hypothetical protein
VLYRIFTEDIPENMDAILTAVSLSYDIFTILKGVGFWRGERESSICIEISVESDPEGIDDLLIRSVAGMIKKANHQDSVLVQKIECSQTFV